MVKEENLSIRIEGLCRETAERSVGIRMGDAVSCRGLSQAMHLQQASLFELICLGSLSRAVFRTRIVPIFQPSQEVP